ncbi:hypothetical protein CEXT_306461, partial [Caerostris extrusa]
MLKHHVKHSSVIKRCSLKRNIKSSYPKPSEILHSANCFISLGLVTPPSSCEPSLLNKDVECLNAKRSSTQ